jgi:hypothetical protein
MMIVSVKRNREFRTSTIKKHEHEFEQSDRARQSV